MPIVLKKKLHNIYVIVILLSLSLLYLSSVHVFLFISNKEDLCGQGGCCLETSSQVVQSCDKLIQSCDKLVQSCDKLVHSCDKTTPSFIQYTYLSLDICMSVSCCSGSIWSHHRQGEKRLSDYCVLLRLRRHQVQIPVQGHH